MGKWINQRDKKPRLIRRKDECGSKLLESNFVLGCTIDDRIVIVRYSVEGDFSFWADEEEMPMRITHWMALPKPPKRL